jgi:nucleoside phosphorylase/predicted nucleotidyltransferase
VPRRVSPDAQRRVVDLADVVLDVGDILGDPALDVYLFGSRAYRTGSIRSDIDLLVRTSSVPTRDQAVALFALEPYLDVFVFEGGVATSLTNGSVISKAEDAKLLNALDAVQLVAAGSWVTSGGDHQEQYVLTERSPLATSAELYDSTLPATRADILVVTALPKEFLAGVGALGAIADGGIAHAEVVDRKARPWSIELISINAMGSVAAALETHEGLRRTKAPDVVLLGIAAGFPGKVELGDIVIPDQIVYYESQKLLPFRAMKGFDWKPTSEPVRQAIVTPYLAGLSGARRQVRVHTDVVLACGEKVVASGRFRRSLSPSHRKLAAIDMESYGVACAAERRGARTTVIKSICDYADGRKNDDYQDFAAQTAAAMFAELVRNGAFAQRDSD